MSFDILVPATELVYKYLLTISISEKSKSLWFSIELKHSLNKLEEKYVTIIIEILYINQSIICY
jgi:hypothetical protein